jgi:hypothetical protein
MSEDLTQDLLKSLISYDPKTGVFRWLVDRGGGVRAGDVAGSVGKDSGYIFICVYNRLYRAHRLAWLYVTGRWPAAEIDHINLVRADNRFANLREASHSENCRNRRRQKNNVSGVRGVHMDKRRGKWQARIKVNGRKLYLGMFTDIADAAAAYAEAASRYHGEFGRTDLARKALGDKTP